MALISTIQTSRSNRHLRHSPSLRRIERLKGSLLENGPVWTSYYIAYRVLSGVSRKLDAMMRDLELRHGLPARNSVVSNFNTWETHDWSQLGEEWTFSQEWKDALITDVMHKYVGKNSNVLEIGPGGGRWTGELQKLAASLAVVDLSPKCIDICRARFSACPNVQYFVNDGRTLPFIAGSSVDYIWSFAVFAHIAPPDVDTYLGEFARVLKTGGRGVIQHPKFGGLEDEARSRWQSRMTAEMFVSLLNKHSLRLVSQFDSWGDERRFTVSDYEDVVTVFEK